MMLPEDDLNSIVGLAGAEPTCARRRVRCESDAGWRGNWLAL
jgi:hypothetical protein